jgi:hypothetical protein
MSVEKMSNEHSNNQNFKLNEWGREYEEEKVSKRRKVIHSYLEDFKNLDSESLYPWGDLSMFVESF